MNEYKISIYTTPDGKIPFLEWLNSLKDNTVKRRIRLRIDRLSLGNFGDTKPLGEGLYELRLFFGSGYRVYYAVENDTLVILLTGGDKSTQKDDILKANMYLKEYKGGTNDR